MGWSHCENGHAPNTTQINYKLGAKPTTERLLYMTWGRTLKNALTSVGVESKFSVWSKIAQDRQKWRKRIRGENDEENDKTIR